MANEVSEDMSSHSNASNDLAASPRLVLPREDGSILCVPCPTDSTEAVAINRDRLNGSQVNIQGKQLCELRSWTSSVLFEEGRRYTRSLVQSDDFFNSSAPFVVTGHQPEFFHAGVWAKNFAASALAHRTGGIAINLIIDNDLCDGVRIRIPSRSTSGPHVELIPFDAPQAPRPWEEVTVTDRGIYSEFGARLTRHMKDNWSFEPMLARYWAAAQEQLTTSRRVCDGISAARAFAERDCGLNNIELPMSRVCETSPFRWFAAYLLTNLPRVHSCYNDALKAYRQSHRLRNHLQPVPNLESHEEWLEAPFWLWPQGGTFREKPFVRRVGAELELRDSRSVLARWTQPESEAADSTVAMLTDLASRGLRFRTRALTTTLFARTCLADLFIHGIGGAKYDVITDRLIEELFGMKAPSFTVVSGTFHLPLGESSRTKRLDEQTLKHHLRDLRFNPDRYLGASAERELATLAREKRELIAALASRRPTALETRRIEDINSKLAASTSHLQEHWQADLLELRQQREREAILRDREYAWCLFPADHLPQKLLTAFQS